MQTSHFEPLARRYTGTRAEHYDARRTGTPKWQAEQAIVERLVAGLPRGASLLDIPVGTGRFLPLYARLGIRAVGVDVSQDMLNRAREKDPAVPLRLGDIRGIDAPDGAYDCALCIRFLNWVELDAFRSALHELARVSRRDVIVSVRSYRPRGALKSMVRTLRTRLIGAPPRPEGQLVIHERADVHAAFRRERLQLVKAWLVEASADASDFYIYHLTKG